VACDDQILKVPGYYSLECVEGVFSDVRMQDPHSPAPIGQGRRRGDAHTAGCYVLVYADTTTQGRGLRASGRGRAKAALVEDDQCPSTTRPTIHAL
jgi:hypothetical protein